MNYAIILAGGTGSRVGAGRPKQFVRVLGKPVLAYTLEIFERNPQIDAVEVGCHVDWMNYLYEMISEYNLKKVKWVVNGGDTFQQTVINCINGLSDKINKDDFVVIHYGAAPFTKQDIVDEALAVAHKKEMACACTPIYQLIGTNDGADYDGIGVSNNWVDRDKHIQIACPQVFRYSYIMRIYEEATNRGLLNKVEPHTTSLMYELGYPIFESLSDQTNIKITTKEDLELFEGWVRMNQERLNRGEDWL